MTETRSTISIVTPAFNESENLVKIHAEIKALFANISHEFEWIVVDDHSSDQTFECIQELNAKDERVKGVRLSRNFGSHMALLCGINLASGDALISLAGDGQEPVALMSDMIDVWGNGMQVVWGARTNNSSSEFGGKVANRLFYKYMRQSINNSSLPTRGSDYFLIDRKVINAIREVPEGNMNVMTLIAWMGFKSHQIPYKRYDRLQGESGWSFAKKVKLAIDSIISYSMFPIRLMALVGGLVALAGVGYVPVIILNAYLGSPVPGWTELMVVVLVIGGVQMLMLSVLGEYLWRTFCESRNRPRYLIEDATNNAKEEL